MVDQRQRKASKYPTANTLRAEVLAVLLTSDEPAGTDSAFIFSNTNVSTVIRALTKKCHWPIERHDCAVDLGDGRSGWASTWSLPQNVIETALGAGAAGAAGRDWLESVRAAREVRAKRLAGPLAGIR